MKNMKLKKLKGIWNFLKENVTKWDRIKEAWEIGMGGKKIENYKRLFCKLCLSGKPNQINQT